MTFLPYKTAEPAKTYHFALGETKETASGFVYYLSIPDVIQTMMDCGGTVDDQTVLRHLLDSQVTHDSALLLKKNHWSADVTSALTSTIVSERES